MFNRFVLRKQNKFFRTYLIFIGDKNRFKRKTLNLRLYDQKLKFNKSNKRK